MPLFKTFIYFLLQCSKWLQRIHRWSEMLGTILYSIGVCLAWKICHVIFHFFQYYDLLNTDFGGLHEAILVSLNSSKTIGSRTCWLEYTSNRTSVLHLYFCHFFCGELENEDTGDTKEWGNMGQGLLDKEMYFKTEVPNPLSHRLLLVHGPLATGPCKRWASMCETISPIPLLVHEARKVGDRCLQNMDSIHFNHRNGIMAKENLTSSPSEQMKRHPLRAKVLMGLALSKHCYLKTQTT